MELNHLRERFRRSALPMSYMGLFVPMRNACLACQLDRIRLVAAETFGDDLDLQAGLVGRENLLTLGRRSFPTSGHFSTDSSRAADTGTHGQSHRHSILAASDRAR